MGLFDFMRKKRLQPTTDEKPTKAEFARKILDGLQAASVEGLAYDADSFSIMLTQPQTRFYLNNAYDEFLAASTDEAKNQILIRYVSFAQHGTPSTPEDWEDVKTSILPLIRNRTFLHDLGERFFSEPEKGVPWQIIGESLGLCVGHDTPTALNYVNQGTLSKWNVRFEEALSQTLENLLAKSTEPFIQLEPGFYRSPWSDCYDPARLVVPEIFKRLNLRGSPVVTVPHWNALFVADSEIPESLLALAKVTENEMRQPRNNYTQPLILSENGWKPFLPATDHPAFVPLSRVRNMACLFDYSEQIGHLKEKFEKEKRDIFVATVSAFQNEQSGVITSQVQWLNGIVTLLARTDHVLLYDPALPEKERILGLAQWDDLASIVPELKQAVPDCYPPFYLVHRFPDLDLVRRLKLSKP